MAGSASAAIVITGKNIVNGTVTTKDVKNKTLLLKDIKPAERAKLKGQDGAPGASAFAPPPSGTLVVGGGILSGDTDGAGIELRYFSPLPFKGAVPFSEDGSGRNIFFAPNAATFDSGESAVLCSGTDDAPTPTAGFLCIYTVATTNVQANSTAVYAGVQNNADGADSTGFNITPNSNAAGTLTYRYVWAYRAP
jgi:hypothetical protein